MAMTFTRFLEVQKVVRGSINKSDGYMCSVIVEDNKGRMNTIHFDLVKGVNISSSSELTTNTMMNGDIIADHIYRKPVEVTIDGSYGEFGNRNIRFSGPWDKLGNVEEYFENIKNQGYRCSIITRSRSTEDDTRFKTRENMVLTNIDWTHNQSSISFSLTFTEQKTASLQIQDIPYTEEDEDGPDITDGVVTSFTEDVLDWNVVYKAIIILLDEDNMMTDDFKQELSECSSQAAIGAGLVIGGAVAGGIMTALVGLGVAGPGGWLLIGIGAVLGVIGYGIYSWINGAQQAADLQRAQEKWGTEQFQYFEGDDERNEDELNRFFSFVGGVADYVKTLDNYITAYNIPTNSEQEMLIYIDDDNYVFKFNKVSNSIGWNVRLTNTAGTSLCDRRCWGGALSDISQCLDKEGSYLYRTSGRYRIYLMYRKLNSDGSPDESGKNDLTNYFILISTINMEQFGELLNELIRNGGTVPKDRIQEYSNME